DLKIIEIELAAAVQPGIVGEQGSGAVVAMRVDWPVREDDVGILGREKLFEVGVSRIIDFGIAIDLARENGLRAQNGADFFRLRRADGRRFVRGVSGDAGLSACEIEEGYVVALF